MQNALRKASEASGTEDVAQAGRRAKMRPVDADMHHNGAGVEADVMIDPLHPMHRDLLARISGSSIPDEGLTKPQRLAFMFYAAIASWGLVWLTFQAVIAIL